MELIKVRDNQNRPINGIDIIMSAVFGNKVPREFVPGDNYQIGEHVYRIDGGGNLIIYECTKTGKYYNCTDPEFKEWTIESIMKKCNDAADRINDLFVRDKIGDLVLYDFKSLRTPCASEVIDNKLKIKADLSELNVSKYIRDHNILDIFVNFKDADNYILPSEYTFEGNNINITLDNNGINLQRAYTSNFYPEGTPTQSTIDINQYSVDGYFGFADVTDNTKIFAIDPDTQEPYFWYGENGETKSFKATSNGINLKNFNILHEIGKDRAFGYNVCDFKIISVHTVVPSGLNNLQDKLVYRLDTFDINGNHDSISSENDSSIQSINIPISIEPTNDISDELIVEFNKDTQLIDITSKNGYIKQIKYSVVARKLDPLTVYAIGGTVRSNMTRYLRRTTEIGSSVEIDGKKYIEFPCYDLLKYNSFTFDLYINRVHASNYEQYIDKNGKLYVKLLDTEYVDYDQNEFVFQIYYSISNGVGIDKTSDERIVIDDKDAFRIFLTKEFTNNHQWLRLYQDFKNIPPEVSIGSKTSANISDQDYYLSFGQTLKSDVFTMYFKDILGLTGSRKDGCHIESYPIMETTRSINIPFAKYDPDIDDFLIFKTGGVLLNSSKWYLNNNQVNLYIHEPPMVHDDYVDFRLLNRDENIRVFNKFVTASEAGQTLFEIKDTTGKLPIFFMVFTMSGEFISPSKYNYNNYTIEFKSDISQPVEVYMGTRFEIVYGVYTSDMCKTIYHTIQIPATVDDQKEFPIDESVDFNIDTNNLLIFREDGMYVGSKFYHIDPIENKIIIDKGTGVTKGSYIDVIVIRNLSLEVPVELEQEVPNEV